jgi:hypothetical protein
VSEGDEAGADEVDEESGEGEGEGSAEDEDKDEGEGGDQKEEEDLFVQLDEEEKDALLENTVSVHIIFEKVHSCYAYTCCYRS